MRHPVKQSTTRMMMMAKRALREATSIIRRMEDRLTKVRRKQKAEMEFAPFRGPPRTKRGESLLFETPAADGSSSPLLRMPNLLQYGADAHYQMEALAYHEGIPGPPHCRSPLPQRMEACRNFRQKFGVYTPLFGRAGGSIQVSARRGVSMRIPILDFGRHAMELWRLVVWFVDTACITKRRNLRRPSTIWLEYTPTLEVTSSMRSSVYSVMPGQATAYIER